MAPDFIERLKASAWHQLYLPLLPFTHAGSKSVNADSLKLQLLTARKKEWWPPTADSLPQAVTCQLKHTALAGIEPTTFGLYVRRATSVLPTVPRPLVQHCHAQRQCTVLYSVEVLVTGL